MSSCPNLTTNDIQLAIEHFNKAYVIYKNNSTDANKKTLLDLHNNLVAVIQCYENNINPTSAYNEQSYLDLVSKYNKVVKDRNDLDIKLREIYNIKNTLPFDNRLYMDSSIYSTVLLSIFATSILFIFFVKL